MRTAAVSQLKATLSRFLDRVKAGEEVVVTDRGRPIARIVPVLPLREAVSSQLLELERAGLARIGTGKLPDGFWAIPRPRDEAGRGLEALVEERAEGR